MKRYAIALVASVFSALCAMGLALATPDGWATWRVGLGVFCAAAAVGAFMAWIAEADIP